MTLTERLSTVRGFLGRYFEHLKESGTQQEAYEKTETEFSEIFRRKRYANYESFRKVKNRIIRQKTNAL